MYRDDCSVFYFFTVLPNVCILFVVSQYMIQCYIVIPESTKCNKKYGVLYELYIMMYESRPLPVPQSISQVRKSVYMSI